MLEWLFNILNTIEENTLVSISYVIYGLFLLVAFYSRRLNANSKPASPASRVLTCLANSKIAKTKKTGYIKFKNKSAKSKMLEKNKNALEKAKHLKKIDWFFYDKLKFFPDGRTGHNLNLLFMICGPIIVIMFVEGYMNSEIRSTYSSIRSHGYQNSEEIMSLQLAFFLILAYISIIVVIFLFFGKNREIYLDNTVLFFLFYLSCYKLLICFKYGCCFGIPSDWGIYNKNLEATAFPVALFEFLVGILLFLLCFIYMAYSKHYKPGQLSSFCLISYAVPRFFWDYLRYHGEEFRGTEVDGFFGLTMVQATCIVAVILAIIWLIILPYEKKIMDKVTQLFLIKMKKIIAKIYFSPRLHKTLSKHISWHPGIDKLKEVHTA